MSDVMIKKTIPEKNISDILNSIEIILNVEGKKQFRTRLNNSTRGVCFLADIFSQLTSVEKTAVKRFFKIGIKESLLVADTDISGDFEDNPEPPPE